MQDGEAQAVSQRHMTKGCLLNESELLEDCKLWDLMVAKVGVESITSYMLKVTKAVQHSPSIAHRREIR